MARTWTIELFGPLRAQSGDLIIDHWATERAAALLSLLALQMGQELRRDKITELLWPGEADAKLRMRLNYTFWTIRRLLEPPGTPTGEIFISTRNSLCLRKENTSTDVAAFQNCFREADRAKSLNQRIAHLEEATTLYADGLLPWLFDDWVSNYRQSMEDKYLEVLRQLIVLHEEQGDLVQSIAYAQQLLSIDNLQEEIHTELLRLYLQLGQPKAVQRHYNKMCQILRTHLDTEPGPEAQAWLELSKSKEHLEQGHFKKLRLRLKQLELSGKEEEDRIVTKHSVPRPRIPTPPTHFFGRDEELQALVNTISSGTSCLVTIVGTGGCGKTRIALEAGQRLREAYSDNVWFVPLERLSSANNFFDAIREALQLSGSGTTSFNQIVSFLGSLQTRCLLILDNFEHISEEASPFVRQLMDAIPNLSCLVTSRHHLMLEGEREFALQPLATPSIKEDDVIEIDELLSCPSVRLFVDRAQAVRAFFQVTEKNGKDVAMLCKRLEGLPLALELAAAWSQAMTPGRILERLKQGENILVNRKRDVPERHKTLSGAIEYSYSLMTDELQRFFNKLSVFKGGWSEEAAHWVCGKHDEPTATLSALAQLVERSLIISEETRSGMRYRILESLREFAQQQLDTEEALEARRHHAQFFAKAAWKYNLKTLEKETFLEGLESYDNDLENYRSAINWSLSNNEPLLALRIAAGQKHYLPIRGYFQEGLDIYKRTLEATDSMNGDEWFKCHGLLGLSTCQFRLSDYVAAKETAEKALKIAEAIEDEQLMISSYTMIGNNCSHINELDRSLECHRTCEQLSRMKGDLSGVSRALLNIGCVENTRKNYKEALAIFKQSEVYNKQLQTPELSGTLFANIGSCLVNLNQSEKALPYFSRAQEYMELIDDISGKVQCHTNLANAYSKLNEPAKAVEHLIEALDLNRSTGMVEKTHRILTAIRTITKTYGDFDENGQLAKLISESAPGSSSYFIPQFHREMYLATKELLQELSEKKWSLSA